MANYDPSLRSNSFRVKDREAFAKWIEEGTESELMIDFDTSGPDRVVVYGATDVPSHDNEGEEVNFFEVLATHLVEDDVAIFFTIGAEKLRYLVGMAFAIHACGDVIEVTLDSIYKEAAENFPDSTIRQAW